MIPAEFDYVAPDTLDEALQGAGRRGRGRQGAGRRPLAPAAHEGAARRPDACSSTCASSPISGASPSRTGRIRVGRADPARRPAGPAPSSACSGATASKIADQQVRNRGTIGGSLAHGDPASDLPAVVLAAEGTLHVRGPGGERQIAAADLFQDYLETALEPGELITAIDLPDLGGWSLGYEKFIRRAEDWAMVGVARWSRRRRTARARMSAWA